MRCICHVIGEGFEFEYLNPRHSHHPEMCRNYANYKRAGTKSVLCGSGFICMYLYMYRYLSIYIEIYIYSFTRCFSQHFRQSADDPNVENKEAISAAIKGARCPPRVRVRSSRNLEINVCIALSFCASCYFQTSGDYWPSSVSRRQKWTAFCLEAWLKESQKCGSVQSCGNRQTFAT